MAWGPLGPPALPPARGPRPALVEPLCYGPASLDPGLHAPPASGPRAPEVIEAFFVPFEKAAQVEVRAVLTVPFLQLLELRILRERSHGERSGKHELGRGRRQKKGGRRTASRGLGAAVFMAQALRPAPPTRPRP